MVTPTTPIRVMIVIPVRIREVESIRPNTTTRVMMELAAWGMDWDTICRRVSMSLV